MRPDADALVVGQADGAMLAIPRPLRMRERQHRREGGGATIDVRDETRRRPMKTSAEIMVRAEKLPIGCRRTDDPDIEREKGISPNGIQLSTCTLPVR